MWVPPATEPWTQTLSERAPSPRPCRGEARLCKAEASCLPWLRAAGGQGGSWVRTSWGASPLVPAPTHTRAVSFHSVSLTVWSSHHRSVLRHLMSDCFLLAPEWPSQLENGLWLLSHRNFAWALPLCPEGLFLPCSHAIPPPLTQSFLRSPYQTLNTRYLLWPAMVTRWSLHSTWGLRSCSFFAAAHKAPQPPPSAPPPLPWRAGPETSSGPSFPAVPLPQSCQKNMPNTNPGPQRLILIFK